MGCNYTKPIRYEGMNCCLPDGCDGHTLRVVSDRCSDVIMIEIDGKNEYYLDPGVLNAVVEALKGGFK
jgi:hypothetical protein